MDPVAEGLAFIDSLERTEQTAFLGLFAGARFPWHAPGDGRQPFMGKAECEWVEDWRDFYGRRLVDAGLFRFEESELRPAHGMVYPTYTVIDCGPTKLGCAVREAWWKRWREKVDENAAARDAAHSQG